ncbi:MAG: hypothetical protein R3C16_13380 [Hyphomonadaceae bacterium]
MKWLTGAYAPEAQRSARLWARPQAARSATTPPNATACRKVRTILLRPVQQPVSNDPYYQDDGYSGSPYRESGYYGDDRYNRDCRMGRSSPAIRTAASTPTTC